MPLILYQATTATIEKYSLNFVFTNTAVLHRKIVILKHSTELHAA